MLSLNDAPLSGMMIEKPIHRAFHPAAALGLFFSFSGLALLSAPTVRGSDQRSGRQIFQTRCASCHGARGEGTKRYSKALTGDKSAGQLARFIQQSMPPGPGRKWVDDDAQKVAAYIYNAFYSTLAQARNKPARIELSRLTVRQYRNAVADLMGSFRAPAGGAMTAGQGRVSQAAGKALLASTRDPSAQPAKAGFVSTEPHFNGAAPGGPGTNEDQNSVPVHGLRGDYFKSGHLRDRDQILERVDPEIRFDFGTAGALPQQSDPYQFAMRWEGSVLAPETGEYDFIVRTQDAARLWLNDPKQPLIDASVRSGNETEYRASLFLLGGRLYPLRLEFEKGVQGVDDLKKVMQKPPAKASLTLEWKPPQQADEVIPRQDLYPLPSPVTFALATPFPPDDRSTGYERGTSVSKAWEEATTEAAIEAAGYATKHLSELVGIEDGAPDREARVREFCRQFAERAFRRPLTPALEQLYVTRQLQKAPDLETGVKRVVLLVLQSPRFLYRGIDAAKPDAYDVASRLSFGLWDSLPDDELLKAAAAGQLSTREQVTRHAERMLDDPRAWSKLRAFLLQWLKVDQYPDLSKDPKLFPHFDDTVAADLRTSLALFLRHVAWSDRSDFRQLLLSNDVYLNGRLARIYGVNLPPDAPFQLVRLDPTERAGVLTQPYLLSCFAHPDTSSPIHRGVLIVRSVLGRTLQPPPAAFTPLPAALHPGMTTRQRIVLQTQPATCHSCHGMINPLGFTLEEFDAIGRLRQWENGKPIDTTGSYQPLKGPAARFFGARTLARYLAGSEEAHAAFAQKLFQYMMKQPIRAYGPRTLPELEKAFAENEYSIRKEMVAIVTAAALKR